jgi:hypothetical protein
MFTMNGAIAVQYQRAIHETNLLLNGRQPDMLLDLLRANPARAIGL